MKTLDEYNSPERRRAGQACTFVARAIMDAVRGVRDVDWLEEEEGFCDLVAAMEAAMEAALDDGNFIDHRRWRPPSSTGPSSVVTRGRAGRGASGGARRRAGRRRGKGRGVRRIRARARR